MPHNCSRTTGRKERTLVACSWPECSERVRCLVLPPSKFQNYTRYRVNIGSMAASIRYPVCEFHQKRIVEMLGTGYKLNGIKAIINGQDVLASKRVSAPLTRLVIYEKTDGACADCCTPLEFNGRWHADHVRPIFRGGLTTFSNLQALCTACHDKKTSLEKSDFNKKRYSMEQRSWQNRHQLLQLIEKQNREIARLKTIIASYANEEEMAG